jgi:preprotein translocase subunit SecA
MFNFLNKSKRKIKKVKKQLKGLREVEKSLEEKSFKELKSLSSLLKNRYKKDGKLEDIILEASAIIKVATNKKYNISLYDVQLVTGILLNENNITEMKTGEGKTFAAMLTAFIYYLKGQKLYIATANDYLAKRDSELVSEVLNELGLNISFVDRKLSYFEKIENYKADIVYGTTIVFAFDYLNDNLALTKKAVSQNERYGILMDEADLSLIDQARTPLTLTGSQNEDDIYLYELFNNEIARFTNNENNNIFELDLDSKSVTLLEKGYTELENFLIEKEFISKKEEMYISRNLKYLHVLNNCLKAIHIYKIDNDYIIKNDEVVIIDEKTGRISEGKRWGNGLHQAIEAKEGIKIQKESNTTASITIQNYLKKFKCVSGMTGTAKTEAREFKNVYNLNVVVVPPNQQLQREDSADVVFIKKAAKINAIVEDVKDKHKIGRPILIGTNSVEASMEIADALYKVNIKYKLLNAKHHEKESEVISAAGTFEAVTIATNMAGRGTDIMLGGNREEVIEDLINKNQCSYKEAFAIWKTENEKINELGGLYIVGAERNMARRMDNQLIGRSGRQGDNGASRFYISLEDDLIKNYGLTKIKKLFEALGIAEDEAVTNPTIDMNIAMIQKRIESAAEEARKMILSFDDINEEQRNIIYELRNKILNKEDSLDDFIIKFTTPQIAKMIQKFANDAYTDDHWDLKGLEEYLSKILKKDLDIEEWFKKDSSLGIEDIINKVREEFKNILKERKKEHNENYTNIQRETILKVIDEQWGSQLSSLNELKNRVFFRSYAQEKPLEEYQKEIFKEFKQKINNMEEDFILSLCHMEAPLTYKDFMNNFRYGLSPLKGIGI